MNEYSKCPLCGQHTVTDMCHNPGCEPKFPFADEWQQYVDDMQASIDALAARRKRYLANGGGE